MKFCSNIDGSGGHYAKWNKSDREQQILYDITYMWNLKKGYKWTYLENRSRITDVENKLMVNRGKWGWDKLGDWIDIYIQLYIK